MKYFPTPESEEWRGEVIHELLEARKNSMDIRGFDNNEISEMLQYLCSNWGKLSHFYFFDYTTP